MKLKTSGAVSPGSTTASGNQPQKTELMDTKPTDVLNGVSSESGDDGNHQAIVNSDLTLNPVSSISGTPAASSPTPVLNKSNPTVSQNRKQKFDTSGPGGSAKRKSLRYDVNAPRRPATAYLLFMNDARAQTAQEHPGERSSEITRLVAEKWRLTMAEEKKQYFDESLRRREVYNEDMVQYRKTENYKKYLARIKAQRLMAVDGPSSPACFPEDDMIGDKVHIPIFSKEFLAHNKERDTELRNVKRRAGELEEELTRLEKHVNGLEVALSTSNVQSEQLLKENESTRNQLNTARIALANAFKDAALPDGSHPAPTLDTIDHFMIALHGLILNKSTEYADFVNFAKLTVGRINFGDI